MTIQRGRKSLAAIATGFVPVDGRSSVMRPPASMSEAGRTVFIDTVTAAKPGHLLPSDQALLVRYCETAAQCDIIAKKLAADVAKGRPTQSLVMLDKLTRLLLSLARSLKLSPLSRSPNKSGHEQAVDFNGHGHTSVYERMALDDPQ